LASVFAAAEAAQSLLLLQDTHDARVLFGQNKVAQATSDLTALAAELTRRRKAAAAPLEKAVSGEIHQLAMPSARFVVQFEALAEIGPTGAERMQFHLAANAGHQPQP
jgi:DNA repair protein RecN (Recombination protein N)